MSAQLDAEEDFWNLHESSDAAVKFLEATGHWYAMDQQHYTATTTGTLTNDHGVEMIVLATSNPRTMERIREATNLPSKVTA